MDIIDHIEVAMERMAEDSDLIVNECYILYALPGWPGVGSMSDDEQRELIAAISRCVAGTGCEVKAINLIEGEIVFLIKLNLEVSVDGVVEACRKASESGDRLEWAGDYAAITMSAGYVPNLADSIKLGDKHVLDLFEEDVDLFEEE